MLVRFNIGNVLSFKNIQEFSMFKGKPKNKNDRVYENKSLKLLKFASIFGANASGKSNLVKSMALAKKIILSGDVESPDLQELYFKLDKKYKTKPSYFEFEVLIKGKLYSYGFEVILNKNKIIGEWLIALSPSGSEFNIFTRNLENPTQPIITTDLKIKDKVLENKFNVYLDDIRANQQSLFLGEMNRNKPNIGKDNELSIFSDLYSWFFNKLQITYPDMPVSPLTSFWKGDNKEKIKTLLRSLDTGITDYVEKEVDVKQVLKNLPLDISRRVEDDIKKLQSQANKNKKLYNSIIRLNEAYFLVSADKNSKVTVSTLKFIHTEESILFDFKEESDGTRRIFDILEVLLTKKDKVFVIDEIDRSLHPQLTHRFVKLFLEIAKKQNIQLIITTHESRLLDFNLLRQDEIWLIEKDKSGSSKLYSLDEYNVRFDRKVDKAYLEGRYGGVPIFTTLFPINEE